MKDKVYSLCKNICEYIGGIALFAAGLFFVLIADTKISLNSYWMFIIIVLASAGGILFFISEYQKDKPIKFYIMKGLGILVSVGFLVSLLVFKNKFVDIPKPNKFSPMLFYVSFIVTCLGLGCQVANTTLNVIKGID